VINGRFAAEPWALWVLQHLFEYYLSTGNTRGLYDILSSGMNRGSDDAILKNNLATVSMLLHTNLPMAQTLARQVYERERANPWFASTYAYSLHLQGKTQEALTLLQSLKPSDLRHSSIALYYGTILAAAGQGAKAKEYLDYAEDPKATLLPEEREILLQARRLASARTP
jgi:hypothetical protein